MAQGKSPAAEQTCIVFENTWNIVASTFSTHHEQEKGALEKRKSVYNRLFATVFIIH